MRTLELAEAATLGSLLIRPVALAEVRPWLRAQDFEDPWNQQLYRVMQELDVAREPLAVESVGRSLAERVGHQRADLPRVTTLLRAAPPHPRVELYARMVLEMSLRRELALQGVLLRACALSSALSQTGRPVVVGAAMVDQTLGEGERRWQLASGESSPPSTTHPELAPSLRNLDRYLASDRFLAAYPESNGEQVSEDERATVAALMRHQDQRDEICAWLHPELLTEPAWRVTYEAVLALAERASTVDAVTVAWELQRCESWRSCSPAPLELVRAADDAMNFDARFYARRVATHALKRTADASARLLDSAAANVGLQVPELYATGAVATSALRAVAELLESPRRGTHLQAVPTVIEPRRNSTQAVG